MAKQSGRSAVLVMLLASAATADTLVLRNGQRIEGTLVGVRGDRIEFEESGWGRRRVRSFDRDEVRRIEFDDEAAHRDDGRSSFGGMRERTVNVDAAKAWTDTGIDVRRGQELRFRASGKVRWGPGRDDGPRGEGGDHYNEKRPIPNRPAAALIGRIGSGDDVFFIGDDDGVIRMRDSGRLQLGINDDFLQDNRGSFRVVVYY